MKDQLTKKLYFPENNPRLSPVFPRFSQPFNSMKHRHQQPGRRITAYLQAIMAVLYLAAGLFLLLSDSSARIIPASLLPWTPAVLIAYGIFRAYRSYFQLKGSGIKSA